ncbi:3-phosphoshikimate 1-carboxyvinyltransferase [Devosia sp.]|uniref:3-phosphoshikimate 1-carboxyvinyltransferase n=1 Tax=Devosia sp. TaxID=1871048 RepID=UPI002AFF6CA4|nr:3-phosphoshikimate 1-carboxyvinyltransferase [Devosia sp.]
MIQTAHPSPLPLASRGADALSGSLAAPGDATLAQTALMLAGLAVGRSTLCGLTPTPELVASAEALRQLGVAVAMDGRDWHVDGLGPLGLLEPQAALVPGSAEAATLLLGLLAPYPFTTRLAGPAARLAPALGEALAPIGQVRSEVDGLSLRGSPLPLPLQGTLEGPDAPLKTALLLAAAQTRGTSTLVEPAPSQDHAEKLLAAFGARLSVTEDEAGGSTLALAGLSELRPQHIAIPGDPALAAYLALAALIVPGSDITIENVLINPLRTGLIDTLLEMGGDIHFVNQRLVGSEHVADLRVRSSRMKGVTLSDAHSAAIAGDIALVAVAAACAEGETSIAGGTPALAAVLSAQKIDAKSQDGRLTITGTGKLEGGGKPVSSADPRLAMSLLLLGLVSRKKVALEDAASIEALFPGFVDMLRGAGARIESPKGRQP